MCELQLGFGERDFLCRSLCSFLVLCGLLDASAVVDYGLLSSTVCINIAISLTRIHFNPGIKPDTSKMRKLLQIFDQILIDKMLHF